MYQCINASGIWNSKGKKNGESGRPVCTNTYTLCLLYIYNLKCQSITMIYKIDEKLHDNSPTSV